MLPSSGRQRSNYGHRGSEHKAPARTSIPDDVFEDEFVQATPEALPAAATFRVANVAKESLDLFEAVSMDQGRFAESRPRFALNGCAFDSQRRQHEQEYTEADADDSLFLTPISSPRNSAPSSSSGQLFAEVSMATHVAGEAVYQRAMTTTCQQDRLKLAGIERKQDEPEEIVAGTFLDVSALERLKEQSQERLQERLHIDELSTNVHVDGNPMFEDERVDGRVSSSNDRQAEREARLESLKAVSSDFDTALGVIVEEGNGGSSSCGAKTSDNSTSTYGNGSGDI